MNATSTTFRRQLVRLAVALILAAAAWFVAPRLPLPDRTPEVCAVLAFDVGALLYVLLMWLHIPRPPANDDDDDEDPGGHWWITGLVMLSAAAGLGAIGVMLGDTRGIERLALVAATILLAWLLAQTVFTAHYAHQYRISRLADPQQAGLDFGCPQAPTFADFAYVAFTVGMTFQVSDVATNTPAMRRLVLVHGVVSFFFNTVIIAISVGLAASMLDVAPVAAAL